MTIELVKVEDNLRIKENEYATNPDVIGFTVFTSCIGIVALLKNKTLVGIHLVIFKDAIFGEDPNDVQKVIDKVQDREKVIIVGQDAIWKNPDNGEVITKAYEELKKQLDNPPVVATNDGVFHVKKVGDDLKVMVCIESLPEPQEDQESRSSEDFSSQQDNIVGAKDTPIKFTLPDGISVQIVDNNASAPDPNVFKDVKNGKEEKNPYIKELYVAAPTGAKENFFVCIEKV